MAKTVADFGKTPNFVLMEAGAGAHATAFTNRETEKLKTPEANWPSFSPDFNLMGHIEDLFHTFVVMWENENISTVTDFNQAIFDAWNAFTVEQTDHEIKSLLQIMLKSIFYKVGSVVADQHLALLPPSLPRGIISF